MPYVQTSHKHTSVPPPPTTSSKSVPLSTSGFCLASPKSAFSETGDTHGEEVPDHPPAQSWNFCQSHRKPGASQARVPWTGECTHARVWQRRASATGQSHETGRRAGIRVYVASEPVFLHEGGPFLSVGTASGSQSDYSFFVHKKMFGFCFKDISFDRSGFYVATNTTASVSLGGCCDENTASTYLPSTKSDAFLSFPAVVFYRVLPLYSSV